MDGYGKMKPDTSNVEFKHTKGLPVWMLTPKEEKEIFENWKKNTWKRCDDDVKAFAQCGKDTGYGVWWKCRDLSKKMKNCISSYQKTEFVDLERDLFIQEKIKKLEKENNGNKI